MKRYKEIFFLLILFRLSFSASSQIVQPKFPQAIESIYYQKWVGGREESGRGIHFYITFKRPLATSILLNKIYFNNQEAGVEKLAVNTFVAHFYNRTRNTDLIMHKDSLKEYGNEAPIVKKPKYNLKPNVALLEYRKNGKTQFYKIRNPKEMTMIAYPSSGPCNE